MTEPRRPESFPQCPDTRLRFSAEQRKPSGLWFVNDATGSMVCICAEQDIAMMIAMALENAADAAEAEEAIRKAYLNSTNQRR